ncbi:C-GCAxxG-C-C family protein [Draconibacterium sp. IB214405]|uniref:C-GCAxxG-C-C family protein n=1 Tax=Draconibacterium sp. IB214405 TaxID=3097352 RepID=UPI002A11E2AE|nr:C-GCAxxG-C-C family protein [Draconibacterium sp. IB214405]MDX8339120.1 C-GCAxxG-C-C family protein [Draconibacterium sp. IB214405]
MKNTCSVKKEARSLLFKVGCTGAIYSVVNKNFGQRDSEVEKATGPLCGGILQEGHQCGMLWGATLAAGAEANRRMKDPNAATSLAILAARNFVDSFTQRKSSVNCRDITNCNWKSKLGMIKYFITGKPLNCARLIGRWAPEAITIAEKSLALAPEVSTTPVISCASIVAKKMGADKEKAMMLAGFAGGIGLSGHTCGALGAAVYLGAEKWYRENPGEVRFIVPGAEEKMRDFLFANKGEVHCSKICGQTFATAEEHSEYIRNGGCEKLIDLLAKSN